MLNSLLKFLRYSNIENLPIDSPERLQAHRDLMVKKTILRRVHRDFYKTFTPGLSQLIEGPKIELGSSGWSFLEEYVPDIIKTDILTAPDIQLCISGLHFPFKDSSLSAIFLTNVLHHIPNAHDFFKEADRVLKPEGQIFMMEPHYSLWSSFIWKKFHHEPFDPEGEWHFTSSGPVSCANEALPWIIFHRDIHIFKEKYSQFDIFYKQTHTGFAFLSTGGLSYRSFIPTFLYPVMRMIDKVLSLLTQGASDSFETIILRKK